jgi:hypothetical protein
MMNTDDIPISNPARDKAWAAFIKRKDVKDYFKEDEFKFPLQRGWYELWCQCWDKAWGKGFSDGWDAANGEE